MDAELLIAVDNGGLRYDPTGQVLSLGRCDATGFALQVCEADLRRWMQRLLMMADLQRESHGNVAPVDRAVALVRSELLDWADREATVDLAAAAAAEQAARHLAVVPHAAA